jgi:hypothetical protein
MQAGGRVRGLVPRGLGHQRLSAGGALRAAPSRGPPLRRLLAQQRHDAPARPSPSASPARARQGPVPRDDPRIGLVRKADEAKVNIVPLNQVRNVALCTRSLAAAASSRRALLTIARTRRSEAMSAPKTNMAVSLRTQSSARSGHDARARLRAPPAYLVLVGVKDVIKLRHKPHRRPAVGSGTTGGAWAVSS